MRQFRIREIYLVDDDAVVRMVVGKIFKNIQFQNPIHNFENGKIAIDEILKKAAEKEFDSVSEKILLLLDINMPVMDSWAFLDQFKDLDEHIKNHFLISIITSSIDSSDKLKASSYVDVSDYITKPLSAAQTIEFLKKHGLYEE